MSASAIRITITATKGSTPREAGASMLVWRDHIAGTIGGGALEWQAMAQARAMLADGRDHARLTLPLGPSLGQCCGGVVSLDFTAEAAQAKDRATDPTPVWIWGAGHVGRALAAILAPLGTCSVTWVDIAQDRFPADLPDGVSPLLAQNPADLMPKAPRDAHHLILTHSHDLDLALCHAALSHGFGFCGLIGSQTKWARFRARLAQLGHTPAQILGITCPIGDKCLGKSPQAIAIGTAARFLEITAQPAFEKHRGAESA